MFIIDMTTLESDFVLKSLTRSKANDIRTYDVNHQMSMFAYYYDDYIHLKIRRYNDQRTSSRDWQSIQTAGFIYPDIELNQTEDIYMDHEDNQLHVKLPYSIYKRNDKR